MERLPISCVWLIVLLPVCSIPVSGWIVGVGSCHNTPLNLKKIAARTSVLPLSADHSADHEIFIVGLRDGLIRYRGRVAYDGSQFQGFQIQSNDARTIQDSLEQVLQKRFNRSTPAIRVVGAGRTDAGVSARGQAFHFDLTQEEHEKSQQLWKQQNRTQPPLDYVMNSMLTDEIRVWNVGPAPPPREKILVDLAEDEGEEEEEEEEAVLAKDSRPRLYAWNAIHDTTQKLYSYRICLSVMDPIYRFQRWQVPGDSSPVNVTLLQEALKQYEGTHDFRAFAGAVEQTEKKANRTINSVRTIFECNLVDESDFYGREGYYRIDIVLSGALYKMVRNLVGTAIDVSRNRVDQDTFLRLIDNRGQGQEQLYRRDNRSKPAPPEGLTLERVFYEDDDVF